MYALVATIHIRFFMKAWHQRFLFERDFPLNIFITDVTEFPPHWHEAIEIIYVLNDSLSISINNEIHTLHKSDILLINSEDVHYFPPQSNPVERIILLFELNFIENISDSFQNKRFSQVIFSETDGLDCNKSFVHGTLKNHIIDILHEYENKEEGYRLILRSRLYDILVTLIRQTPTISISPYEKTIKHNRLERLKNVFDYVEQNYQNNISLEEIASVANFSVYYFTRFFKDTIGMTFIQYLNNFRVTKAEELLLHTDDTVTEVAFKSGFGSIKNFNRNFKILKGCSPSQFRKAIS